MRSRRQRLRAVSPATRAAARDLRRRATPAEKALWVVLRDRRLAGVKFRRQHAIAGYSLDFYCASAKLAIEVDGAVHDDPDQKIVDALRTKHLSELGIRVLRLSNELVLKEPSAACERILDALKNPPSKLPLCPSKMGEGVGG